MAKGAKSKAEKKQVVHFQHAEEKRTNIPSAALAGQGALPKAEKKRYYYNPHLPPVIRFDPTGEADRIPALLEKARREPITAEEHQLLAEALRNHQPWLEWTGKREAEEKGFFEVDPVALNIHERISTRAILRAARREDVQRDLFADPREPWKEALKFYQHDMDWTNRLILGDSLQVMSSLAHRENLAGKVQMIYIDPPYGINFRSNFQVEVFSRDVKDREEDMIREAEMVKAYRDSWKLGIHSHVDYLRNRLLSARGLLSDEGSCFIQINDESLHLVRALMDEVFGRENFVAIVTFTKTRPLGAKGLAGIVDYLIWYAKDNSRVKFRPLFVAKDPRENLNYSLLESPTGERRRITSDEREKLSETLDTARLFQGEKLASSGWTSTCFFDIHHQGRIFHPKKTSWRTNRDGMERLSRSERLYAPGDNI